MLGEFVDRRRYETLLSRGRAADTRWIDFESSAMREQYNRRAFALTHRLHEHPLFAMPEVRALCRRMPREDVKFRFGPIAADYDFDNSLGAELRRNLTFEDAVDRTEESQAYVAVYNPERDAVFRPLIEALVAEIAVATAPMDPYLNWFSTYLFVSSRDSVTPYHMDREMNFLLQIRGRKTARLWDPADDEVMSPAQRDELLARASDLRPPYRESFADKAQVFELVAGTGVHHPFIAPHLVETASDLSVTLAITFRTNASDIWTDAHNVNHKLRQWGLSPMRVGRSGTVDAAKAYAIRGFRQLKRLQPRGPATRATA
jgi:hypothetical protein